MRVLTTQQTTAINARRIRMHFLLELAFYFGVIRFTSTPHTVEWASVEWLGGGRMLDIQFPQEDSTLQAHKAVITLDGLDATAISLALNERTENGEVRVHVLMSDPDSHAPLGTFLVHRGLVSDMQIIPTTSAGG